jgi:hypothetical protein
MHFLLCENFSEISSNMQLVTFLFDSVYTMTLFVPVLDSTYVFVHLCFRSYLSNTSECSQ